MTKSKIFFCFCLVFISGIFLASLANIPQLLMLGFLILGIILISVLWGYKKMVFLGFCLIFVALGMWRSENAQSKITDAVIKKQNDSGENKIVIGTVVSEPEIKAASIQFILEPEYFNSLFLEPKIRGQNKILVSASRFPEYKYGDKIKITGKLETPPELDTFDYKGYLARKGIFSVSSWPKIEKISEKNYPGARGLIFSKILNFKQKVRQVINQNLPLPESSVLTAMILGDNSALSSDLKTKLNSTGVRHIIAVSGMHIIILSNMLMPLLLFLGFWRNQAFYISLVLIFLFVVLTGFQPSGVRAGIMAGISLLGQKSGRQATSSRSLVIAAAFMLFFSPGLLLFDVGFQLSFLAALGIIYFSPIIKKWLDFFLKKKITGLRDILATTFAAQIFTLPILVYNFGSISLVSPLTNVLILPFVYWMMFFGFLLAILGLIWQPLAWVLMVPTWFLLAYLLKVVEIFSRPWAVKTAENVHWLWLIIFYLILTAGVWWLRKKTKLKFLDY